MGCAKLRKEIETQRTKRNEMKRNETKYYDTQRNIPKWETKQKYTKIQQEQHEWNEKWWKSLSRMLYWYACIRRFINHSSRQKINA
jgi:hypothetical protein